MPRTNPRLFARRELLLKQHDTLATWVENVPAVNGWRDCSEAINFSLDYQRLNMG